MNAAQRPNDESELLSWDEIRRRYPDQYVCLVTMVMDGAEITFARVIASGQTRRLAFEPAKDSIARYSIHTVRYTGTCTKPLIRPSFVIDDEILELLRS